jgi:hypothetical protein
MKKLITCLAVLAGFTFNISVPRSEAQGVTVQLTTRSSGWQNMATTSTFTTSTNPNPEAQANQVKGVTTGTSLPGVSGLTVLHLKTCSFYQVSVCAPSGAGLLGTGTLPIWDWPDQTLNITSPVWSANGQLTETVTQSSQCQTFAGHQATGTDWIGVQTSAVSVDGGTTVNVKVDAMCAY